MGSHRIGCALVLVALLAACGLGASDGPQLLTTQEDLCAGAAPEYSDNGELIATAVACPFIQHTDNIAKYGSALAGSQGLYDAPALGWRP
jgi:hypothetical protein